MSLVRLHLLKMVFQIKKGTLYTFATVLWPGLHHLGQLEYHNTSAAKGFSYLQIFENVYKI